MTGVGRARRALVGLTLATVLALSGCAAEQTLPPETPMSAEPTRTQPPTGGEPTDEPGTSPSTSTPGTGEPGVSPTPGDIPSPEATTSAAPEPTTTAPSVTPSPEATTSGPTTAPSPQPTEAPTDPAATPEATPPTLLRPPTGYTRADGAVTEDGWTEVLEGRCTFLTRATAGAEPVNPREAAAPRELSAATLAGHQATDGATEPTEATDLPLYNGAAADADPEHRTNLLAADWTNPAGAAVRGAARTEVLLDYWGTAYLDSTELRFVCPDGTFDEDGWAALWPQLRVANPADERPGEWTPVPAAD